MDQPLLTTLGCCLAGIAAYGVMFLLDKVLEWLILRDAAPDPDDETKEN